MHQSGGRHHLTSRLLFSDGPVSTAHGAVVAYWNKGSRTIDPVPRRVARQEFPER